MSDSGLSNIHAVVDALRQWVDGIDFTRQGKDKSLGRDCAGVIVEGIMERGLQDQSGPDGIWLANDPAYAKCKAEKYGPGMDNAPNYRTGQMLSELSLLGTTTYEPQVVTLRYGINAPPTRGAGPLGTILDCDRKVTDIQKAQWRHENGRRFYAITQSDSDAVVAKCEDFTTSYVIDTNTATMAAAGAP